MVGTMEEGIANRVRRQERAKHDRELQNQRDLYEEMLQDQKKQYEGIIQQQDKPAGIKIPFFPRLRPSILWRQWYLFFRWKLHCLRSSAVTTTRNSATL